MEINFFLYVNMYGILIYFLCNPVLDRFCLSKKENKAVHLYSMMMNLNVLSFIAKGAHLNLNEVRPWGNKTKFVDLIDPSTILQNKQLFDIILIRLY